ncbi:TIGR01777 family oxidoreductase [Pseudoalteromonas sp. DL2-H2.2]|uniref:TIGR01777 family oxidoreductase n=1 Tax=Pseudoalteromonas sp. DL2-H2.2 TaxID=2908889 RepID=UPI001F34498C|nr:TIGR01777 family oxidoreductase [Pseudoalteromonas sp. DL2-H2.2]MCF2909004.1 TIGR01777 family oxidoreductase [Pseudoalteromonas sp. DL2-H2.2]
MKVLITGATGLIGSELCKFLVNKHKIVALTRNISKAGRVLDSKIEAVDDLDQVNFNDLDVIINLAGEPIADKRWSEKQKARIMDSRIALTEEISNRIHACDSPPHTFISGSAIGYYGRQPATVKVDEDFNDPYPEFSHQLCKDWEAKANLAHSEQTRVCIVRTGVVLSRQGGALKKMLPAFQFGMGGPMASGKQMMSWIHIDDMVQLLLFLVKHQDLSGVFNATAPAPVSNKEFSERLALTLRRPAMLTMPEFVLKALFGEMSELLIYGQRVLPRRALKANYRFRYPNLDEALQQLFH